MHAWVRAQFCLTLFFFLISLFLVALGPHCCMRAFSSCGEWGLLLIAVHKLSYSKVFGIFLDQGLNPCPLHWQADF